MKKDFIQSAKIIILALAIGVGVSYISAAGGFTAPPCSSPSGCNAEAPLNTSSTGQSKVGALGVGGLAVFGQTNLFGQLVSTSTGRFQGNTSGTTNNYLSFGYDGAHSFINSNKGAGSPGLVINWSTDEDVSIGGGAGGASNLNVDGSMTSAQELRITSKTGSTNVFACFDANGQLFRSDNPCVTPPIGQVTYTTSGFTVNSGNCPGCTNTTFVVPNGVSNITVDLVGGGGGGAGGRDWVTTCTSPFPASCHVYSGGGGGGGGARAIYTFGVTTGTSYTVTVGNYGGGGNYYGTGGSADNGSSGGQSKFFGPSTNLAGNGGGGGQKAPDNNNPDSTIGGQGGAGGTGVTNGSAGGRGGQKTLYVAGNNGGHDEGGNGGSSGAGSPGGIGAGQALQFCTSGGAPGGGGGGGEVESATNGNGCAGSAGRVIVSWN